MYINPLAIRVIILKSGLKFVHSFSEMEVEEKMRNVSCFVEFVSCK